MRSKRIEWCRFCFLWETRRIFREDFNWTRLTQRGGTETRRDRRWRRTLSETHYRKFAYASVKNYAKNPLLRPNVLNDNETEYWKMSFLYGQVERRNIGRVIWKSDFHHLLKNVGGSTAVSRWKILFREPVEIVSEKWTPHYVHAIRSLRQYVFDNKIALKTKKEIRPTVLFTESRKTSLDNIFDATVR